MFSEPRGGSTWLMELLAHVPKTCINWEPLHETFGIIPGELNTGNRPYIPVDDKNPAYYQWLKNILEFNVYTNWTMACLSIVKLLKSKLVITKLIRGNFLIPYFLTNFDFKYRPVLLLRHPIDVCMSQLKGMTNKEEITIAEIPIEMDFFKKIDHSKFLDQLTSPLERNIANWCMNNLPILNQPDRLNQLMIVFYSDLILNPETELRKILDSLNICSRHKNDRIINSINFRKASKTDFRGDLKPDPDEQLSKNFNDLDEQTKKKIQRIFDEFGFTLYNAFSPFPNKEYLEKSLWI
ncbi:MAG: sulfotransferase domain-containing protein [Bacteroidales bacterium]